MSLHGSHLSVESFLFIQSGFALGQHLAAVASKASEPVQDIFEIRDGALLLEFFNLAHVAVWNVCAGSHFVETLRQLVLSQEASLVEIGFFEPFVFLINLILKLGLKFTLHLSNCCWDDVSQDLIGCWNFV